MQPENISITLLFIEGVISFLSPCILPLLPIYISYLAGSTIEEIAHDEKLKKTVFINSFGFVLGISLIFVLLGAGASFIGSFLFKNDMIFKKIASLIIIIFGLHHIGLFNINFLNKEKKMRQQMKTPKFLNAFLLGITFSFGWTPCIGPILGSVLILASSTQNIFTSMFFLLIYSLGLSIPFLITTFSIGLFIRHFKKIYHYFDRIKIISGVIIIIMGILMFLNKI